MKKWDINLNATSASFQVRPYETLPQPFGFSKDISVSHVQVPKRKQMIENKLWQIATASKMTILMTGFMFWMFGNNISIFILFPIFQSLFSSISGLLKFNKVFQPYEHLVSSLIKYKAIYLAINFVLLGIVVYKLSMMGLLPISPTDYLDLVPLYHAKTVIVQSI